MLGEQEFGSFAIGTTGVYCHTRIHFSSAYPVGANAQ
jgi:hypothetical protein